MGLLSTSAKIAVSFIESKAATVQVCSVTGWHPVVQHGFKSQTEGLLMLGMKTHRLLIMHNNLSRSTSGREESCVPEESSAWRRTILPKKGHSSAL